MISSDAGILLLFECVPIVDHYYVVTVLSLLSALLERFEG